MSPFRLVLTSAAPVVLSDFAPTLDSLVYEAIKAQSPDLGEERIIEKMHSILKFNDEWGVFHASSLMFAVTPERGLVAKSYTRVDVFTEGKRSSSMLNIKKRNGKFTPLRLEGGPSKRRLTERPAYAAPYLSFDGVGDGRRVQSLLEFFVSGIGYDAMNCGMGAFSSVIYVPLQVDVSLIADGAAQRPLPVASGAKGLPCQAVLVPPYYDKTKLTDAVAPERVRSMAINKLI